MREPSLVLLAVHAPVLCTLPDFPLRTAGSGAPIGMALAGITTLLFLLRPHRFFASPAFAFGVAPFTLTLAGGIVDALHDAPSLVRTCRVVAGVFAHFGAAVLAHREEPVGTASTLTRKSGPNELRQRIRRRVVLATVLALALGGVLVVAPHLAEGATGPERTFATVIGTTLATSTLLAALPKAMRKTNDRRPRTGRGLTYLAFSAAVVLAAWFIR